MVRQGRREAYKAGRTNNRFCPMQWTKPLLLSHTGDQESGRQPERHSLSLQCAMLFKEPFGGFKAARLMRWVAPMFRQCEKVFEHQRAAAPELLVIQAAVECRRLLVRTPPRYNWSTEVSVEDAGKGAPRTQLLETRLLDGLVRSELPAERVRRRRECLAVP